MTQLNISDLFTPAPSGVNPASPASAPPSGSYLYQLLANAVTLGLPTTSWQPGGVERTIIALMATILAQQDAVVSIMAQGGFLDWAANGTVSYVALNGSTVVQYVTPDPSIPSQNPTGAPGWLDLLAYSVYAVTRIPATYAAQSLALVNTTGSSVGPFSPGSYHAGNPTSGATYSNTASLTIPPSLVAGAAGTIAGVTGTSTVTVQTSGAHGRTTGDVVYIAGLVGITLLGSQFASVTVVDSTHFTLNNVTATGTWTSGGSVYLCTVAPFQADVASTSGSSAPNTVTLPITANPGVFLSNVMGFFGGNWESNGALVTRCRNKLATLSVAGASAAYVYYATSASQILAAQTPSVTLHGVSIVAAKVSANPATGVVTTTIAPQNPVSSTLGAVVTDGVSNLAVTGAASGTGGAVKLTIPSTTTLANNDWVTVSGVVGTTEANGTWRVTLDGADYAATTHLLLQGSTFANAYVSGGTCEAGDIGEVDRVIQTNVVPLGVTAVTQSATAFPVNIAGTVTVPAAYKTTYAAAMNAALMAYFQSLYIGGDPMAVGSISIDVVIGVLYAAGIVTAGQPSIVKSDSGVLLNGSATDLSFPSSIAYAVLGTNSIVVVGV